MEKSDIDLERLKEFLSQCKIPSVSSDTERLGLATIGLYFKKYKEVLQTVQDKLIEKSRSIIRTRPINNDRVDKELCVAINVLCLFFENLHESEW